MKKHILRALRFLFAAALLAALFILPAHAAHYTGDATTGTTYYLEVGDTLHLTNPYSSSGLTYYAYYWGADNAIVSFDPVSGSRYTTITALKPGTTTIEATLQGTIVTRIPQKVWNSFTDSYDTYYINDYSDREYLGAPTVVIRDTTPPVITSQPTSQFAASGKTVSTSLTATDHSALSYQWYYMDVGDSDYTMSSCQTSTYSCTMTEAKSGRLVCCMVSDSEGNYTQSDWVRLSLLGVTRQPADTVVPVGKTASISLQAEGEGLTYQWYWKNAGESDYHASSCKTSTYTTTMIDERSGRQMYCVITNKYGMSVRSNAVTLRKPLNVAFTTQPSGKVVASSTAVSTSVKATGDGITYQWYWKDPGMSAYQVSSCTGSTYSTNLTSVKSGRLIYCVATDRFGTSVKSNTVRLVVFSIVKQPANTYVAAGQTASVPLTAEGDDLKYTWYWKDLDTPAYAVSSCTDSTYTTPMEARKAGRKIYCVITDKYGNTKTTNTVTLNIKDAIKITSQPTDQIVRTATSCSTTVNATGTGLQYQWYWKNAYDSAYQLSSCTSNTYTTAMTTEKSGRYVYCIITDSYGNQLKTNTARLYYLGIDRQPAAVFCGNGKTASTAVEASGMNLTYKWYWKNREANEYSLSSCTGNTYSTVMDANKAERLVYCVITDAFGNTLKTNTAKLSMLAINSQPTWATGALGETVSTSVKADGVGLTYKWYWRNADMEEYLLSSSTGRTYSTSMAEEKSGRQVYCVITDQFGNSITSNTTRLSWLDITTQYSPDVFVTYYIGKTQRFSLNANGEGLTYEWYRATERAYTGALVSTEKAFDYPIEKDSHFYAYCKVTNEYGHYVYSDICCIHHLKFWSSPMESRYFSHGETAHLNITCEGDVVTLEWLISPAGQTEYMTLDPSVYTVERQEWRIDTHMRMPMATELHGAKFIVRITDSTGATLESSPPGYLFLE